MLQLLSKWQRANRSKATGGVLGRMAKEGVKHTIFDDPGLLELLSRTKDWGAERPDDGHYGGLGYTLGEGGGLGGQRLGHPGW